MHIILRTCMLAVMVTEVLSSAGNVWQYRGSLGPDHWHLDFKHCGGVKQSPISIVTDDVVVDADRLTPLTFRGYDIVASNNMSLTNNGHTVQVSLNEKDSIISGGGLLGNYVAEQFHFHWGAEDSRGSEHDVNGAHFPMEMHIVHYNQKYDNVSHAMDKDNGLAVLAFFFRVGRYNTHFAEIIEHFNEIKYKGKESNIKFIKLIDLMPARLSSYYRYEGSLTTPPCYETVTWTIFNETIEIAEEQLEVFRKSLLSNEENEGEIGYDVSDDFRPPQCMFRRKVYASKSMLKYNPIAYTTDNGGRQLQLSSITVALTSFISICLLSLSL